MFELENFLYVLYNWRQLNSQSAEKKSLPRKPKTIKENLQPSRFPQSVLPPPSLSVAPICVLAPLFPPSRCKKPNL